METSSIKINLRDGLLINPAEETSRICEFIRKGVVDVLHRRGGVVGISGGVDSSVVLALSVRALGAERVLGILLPEKESSPESHLLPLKLAEKFNVKTVIENITPILEATECYSRRNEAIQRVFPEFGEGWKCRISLPGSLLDQDTLNVFFLIVTDPAGVEHRARLSPRDYQQIVASSNFKQRSRMMALYYHAELRHYAVIGTPNKNEHDLGFFVKYGDSGTDLNPIVHLFKSQVYQLAHYLDIPAEIIQRVPTSDTYPGAGSQEEFFFRLPHQLLDQVWWALENGYSESTIASQLEISEQQVKRIKQDIFSKISATTTLRMPSLQITDFNTGR